MPQRPSEHMWQRHFQSGFLTLLILLSSSSCWQKVGGGPQPLWIGITKGPEQSTLTAMCPTWFLVVRLHTTTGGGYPTQHCLDGMNPGRGWLHPQGTHHMAERENLQVMPCEGWCRKFTPSSADRGGMDSDRYSAVSEAQSTHQHKRKWWVEKHLVPVHLDMLIFKSTDPNVDVTYTLWRFNVQGLLDQYQEESMMPHIYKSLRGYPCRWVWSLEEDPNLIVMDLVFGDVCEYDTMIHSLYEIRQKEGESVEEYMLQIHEAVAIICHAYPD